MGIIFPKNKVIGHENKDIKADIKYITNNNEYNVRVEKEDMSQAVNNDNIMNISTDTLRLHDSDTEVATYCIPLIQVSFYGQTTHISMDVSDTRKVLNLGLYLKLLDKFLRQFENVTEFIGDEEEYLRLLKLIAMKRKQNGETTKRCYMRLREESKRFVKIYRKRGMASDALDSKEYWGTRQQLLSAKVIADWIDKDNGPLDPIFGAILQPTSGRVGRGDSSVIHKLFFDGRGSMAYHSAVHDAFGYLYTYHKIGPGYCYIGNSNLDDSNPIAGQVAGISFWQNVIDEMEIKKKEDLRL